MDSIGTPGPHLTETLNLDPSPFSPTGTKGPLRLNTIVASLGITPSNLFGQVQQDTQDINSSYHSLQLSAEKRMTSNLTILANYTYSKSIDDLPAGAGVTGFDTYSARPWDDPLRHQFDRGPSEFDHTRRFVASFVYELTTSASQGLWFAKPSEDGNIAESSPHRRGGHSLFCKVRNFPARKLATTAAQYWPELTRMEILSAGKYNWDMGLFKNFEFKERWKVQFRAEFFNVFNRANFFDEDIPSQPNLGNFQKLNGGTFGTFRAGQVGDPRIGQLAVKLFF